MSRIKLLLLLLIIAILSVIFIQNRQPIALKLLCADRAQTCLYQTPALPLSVWIALATLAGAIANLLVQTLNRYGYSDFQRKKVVLDDDLYPSKVSEGTWKNSRSEQDSVADVADTQSYETRQEPQNVERSGSTYSYKYREASDRPKEQEQDSIKNSSVESPTDVNGSTETDNEDWI